MWVARREFCSGMDFSPDLNPPTPGWGEPLLDFYTLARKIAGAEYSGPRTRYAAIRFVHLVECCDMVNLPSALGVSEWP